MTEKNDRTTCPNCDNDFEKSFNYCPHCGQKNKELTLKLSDFIREFLAANFNLDTKVFATLKALLRHPGFLTREYLAGKRTKYITPVRMYLLISIIYFFVLSFNDSKVAIMEVKTEKTPVEQQTSIIAIDPANPDSLYATERFIYDKVKILQSPAGQRMFSRTFKKNISIGMFILIPLTALIFYLFFRRKTHYYIPNLIFTLHLQTLIFFWFTIFSIIAFMVSFEWIAAAELLLILYLIFIWIKRFYSLTTWQTLWRLPLILLTYSMVFLVFVIAVLSISIWRI